MIARRICSALVGLLLLHVSYSGADLSCATHGDQTGVLSSHLAAAHLDADMPMSDAGTSDAPCRIPTQPQCCRGMVSCATTFSLGRSAHVDEHTARRETIAPAMTRVPHSPVMSPDPPPPKA